MVAQNIFSFQQTIATKNARRAVGGVGVGGRVGIQISFPAIFDYPRLADNL
jgi:hypothetical protein